MEQDAQILESMRLHFPRSAIEDAEEAEGGEDGQADVSATPAEDFIARVSSGQLKRASALYSPAEMQVLAKADIAQVSGDTIATFPDITCLTPRGHYDIDLFPTFLRLHGKTYDYKIPYTTVTRLFLLQKPDQRHLYFIVALDPPVRKYPFVVLQVCGRWAFFFSLLFCFIL